jgi:hypothetical protein
MMPSVRKVEARKDKNKKDQKTRQLIEVDCVCIPAQIIGSTLQTKHAANRIENLEKKIKDGFQSKSGTYDCISLNKRNQSAKILSNKI